MLGVTKSKRKQKMTNVHSNWTSVTPNFVNREDCWSQKYKTDIKRETASLLVISSSFLYPNWFPLMPFIQKAQSFRYLSYYTHKASFVGLQHQQLFAH